MTDDAATYPDWQTFFDAGKDARRQEVFNDHDPDDVLYALLKSRNTRRVTAFWAGWVAEADRADHEAGQ